MAVKVLRAYLLEFISNKRTVFVTGYVKESAAVNDVLRLVFNYYAIKTSLQKILLYKILFFVWIAENYLYIPYRTYYKTHTS
jgi:hypothetical protein